MSDTSAFTKTVPINYEKYLGPIFFEPYAEDIVNRIDFDKAVSILEIACGTGRVTRHLVNKMKPGSILVATDLNPDMLTEAKKKVDDDRIDWSVADAQQLPFDNGIFDLVVCQYGVMFFPDKPKAFAEIHRVLKTGGRFIFNTWDETKHNALSQMTQDLMIELFPADPPDFLKKGPYSFYDAALVKTLMSSAGFRNIDIVKVPLVSKSNSVEDPVKGIIEGSPLYGYLVERGVSIDNVKGRLEAMIRQQYPTQILLPMQAFVCSGEKA